MKCAIISCNNEAQIRATETETGKEYDICKSCSEREDYYDIPGVGQYHIKTWQHGMKLRPLEIVAQ